MKKKLLRIFLLIIMFFGIVPATSFGNTNNDVHKVEAYNHTGGEVYFLKPASWSVTNKNVYMFIGHNSYTSTFKMTKVTNTDNLYHVSLSNWGGATYFCFVVHSSYNSGNFGPGNRTGCSNYTNVYNDWTFNSNNIYYVTTTSSSNNTGIVPEHISSSINPSALNVNVKFSCTSGGLISATGYGMSSSNKTKAENTINTSTDGWFAPGSNISLSATSNTGYKFNGWYSDSTYSNQLTSSNSYTASNVSTSTTYYAKFSAIKYNVIFDNGGGTGSMSELTNKSYEETFTLPTCTFSKDGYTFAGWSGSNGNKYIDGQQVSNLTTTDGATITLTALWYKKVNITLDPNEGTVSPTSFYSYYTLAYNDPLGSLPNGLPTPTRKGYTFNGWYYNSSKVSSSDIIDTENDHTLIAEWTENTYTINYYDNKSTNNLAETITYNYTDIINVNQGSIVRDGFTFNGWAKSTTATSATYLNGETISGLTDTNNGTVNLYANWSKTITFYIDIKGIVNNIGESTASGYFVDLYKSSEGGDSNKIKGLAMTQSANNKDIYYVTFNLNNAEIKSIKYYQFGFEQIGGDNNGWKKTPVEAFDISSKACSDFRIIIPSSGPGYHGSDKDYALNLELVEAFTVNYHLLDSTVDNDMVITPYLNPKFIHEEGYMLEGWYLDEELTQRFSNTTLLNTEAGFSYSTPLNLYPKYEKASDYYIYAESLNLPWESFSTYMWSNYFGDENGYNTTYKNASWPGSTKNVTYIGNNIYKVLIDVSKSFDHLIFCDSADKADIKQTIDLELTPEKNYYIFTTEVTENDNGTPCYHVRYEEETDNFLHSQKNISSNVNDFRFIAGFKNTTEAKAYGGAEADQSTKQFGFKFIFVKGTTSYVGYWNFKKEHKYDVIRYDGTVYQSGNELEYSEYYALSLTDDVTFKYGDYDQIIVVACYRDTDGTVQVIRAQEYNIVGTPDNVYLYEIER